MTAALSHFFSSTITAPLLVIQTYQATSIIFDDPTTPFRSTICYYCRGWLTRLRRLQSTRCWIKNIHQLRASYHHNTITMALPSSPLNDIYEYSHQGYVIGHAGLCCLHSSQQTYDMMYAYKTSSIQSFINHIHEQYFAYQQPCHRLNDSQMTEIILNARYVQY